MYGIWFVTGVTVAHLVEKWRQNLAAERDAVMRHYIQTHPEDFIPPRELNILISPSEKQLSEKKLFFCFSASEVWTNVE